MCASLQPAACPIACLVAYATSQVVRYVRHAFTVFLSLAMQKKEGEVAECRAS